MDHLWTPWRSTYIKGTKEKLGCIFCIAAESPNDEERLVVYRGEFNFVILNRYPYTSGHLMVAPYQHVSRLQQTDVQTVCEMMTLARQAEKIIEENYRAQGLNLGMNLGEAAGAGIQEHIHLHVLPRWVGDANFMTTVGETRVIPEELNETYRKMKRAFAGL